MMNGILLIDKPQGLSSHDVVNIVRRVYQTKKVGHTGTLDPDATGLLILGINDGTKIIKYLNNDEKTYEARLCIGTATDTLDKTGRVIDQKPVATLDDVDTVLSSFKGEYIQIPPMYSAIKYQGKRLYEYARKGITIEDRPSRTIKIFDIKRISDILYEDEKAYFSYSVHGSKGLYVRTLSYDIGAKLGYPAHNNALHRTQAGSFHVTNSYTIEQIKTTRPEPISLNEALRFLPKIIVDEEIIRKVRHGMALKLVLFPSLETTRILDQEGSLLAIYMKHPTKPVMKPENVFIKD